MFEQLCAVELFSAAVCNLQCEYCYIPKDQSTLQLHNKIIEKIESGEYIKQLQTLFGERLKCISHWGTEPTLTIHKFKDFYIEALSLFPNLDTISMSTNMMTNPNVLSDFIINFPEHNQTITFRVQISLDGPDWLNDIQRQSSSAEKIVSNVLHFVKRINDEYIPTKDKIEIYFKPTHHTDAFYMFSEMSNVKLYCDFFEDILDRIHKENTNGHIRMSNSCQSTLVGPGQYTVEDGKEYSKVMENFYTVFRSKDKDYKYATFPPPYYQHFCKMIQVFDKTNTSNAQVSCSAGRSQVALDQSGGVSACHRLYFTNDELVSNSMKEHFKNNTIYLGYDEGRETLLHKYSMGQDEDGISKMMYVLNGFHHFHKHKRSCGVSLLKEMSRCGLVSKRYGTDDMLATYFVQFLFMRECHYDGLLGSGSIHLLPLSGIKLFGNGTFEQHYDNLLGGNKC